MSDQMSFMNLINATSSQESESGAVPLDKQDGVTTGRFGRDLVHASLSARAVSERGCLTSGTSGLTGSISSKSADLQRSLENRLRAKTDLVGSTLYKLTWKERTTPLGHSISALRGSVRRTSGNDFGSWPTPTARDHKGGYIGGRIRNGKISTDSLDVTAQLTGWPTPNATNNGRDDTVSVGRNEGGNWDHEGDVGQQFATDVKDGGGKQTNGFWGDVDWLACRDAKWRPVKSGTFPLVNGATSRVGRLRAYGNAITAQVAQGVIESYMEVR